MAQEAILAVKEAEQKADAIEREGEQNAEQLVQEALQAAQAHKREAERQAGVKAQQILSRAREPKPRPGGWRMRSGSARTRAGPKRSTQSSACCSPDTDIPTAGERRDAVWPLCRCSGFRSAR